MAENCKTTGASPQTPLGGFTAHLTVLYDFHFKSENFDDRGIWWMKWLKNAIGQSFMQ